MIKLRTQDFVELKKLTKTQIDSILDLQPEVFLNMPFCTDNYVLRISPKRNLINMVFRPALGNELDAKEFISRAKNTFQS